MAKLEVTTLSLEHIPAAVALQGLCFPLPFPSELLWTHEQLLHHHAIFPEGQLIAIMAGGVVATATSMILSEIDWQTHRDFESTTGGNFLTNHHRAGTTLFGVDISVHPEFRGKGVARALYARRFDLVRSLGLRRFGTTVRMPGFLEWQKTTNRPVHEYAAAVVMNQVFDRTMSPLLKLGVTFEKVLQNHLPDEESGNAAAVLCWENPNYRGLSMREDRTRLINESDQ